MSSKYSHEYIRVVIRKLGKYLTDPKQGYDRRAYLLVNGVRQWPITFPNEHGSRHPPSWTSINMLKADLRVDKRFVDELVSCRKDGADYLREVDLG